MSNFYEEMADFAAMSEGAGYLGQCAEEVAEPFHTQGRAVSDSYDGDFLRGKARQLKLLVVLHEGRRP